MSLLESAGEFTGLMIGFLLTLFVFSFILKDNPLYRFAVHVLVGISAGYAVVIVAREVLLPVVVAILRSPEEPANIVWLVPLLLALLLLFKAIPRLAWLGNASMAAIVGTGAAVALVGAIVGTLWPQITAGYDNIWLTLLMMVLTLFVLLYFHFTGRIGGGDQANEPVWARFVKPVGKGIIVITLGGLFAGLLSTSLVLLTQRVGYFVSAFSQFFTDLGL